MNKTMMDALKRAKRDAREEEIRLYGHPICHNKVFKNKKIYSRKNRGSSRDLEDI